jgi:hypothetical protein
MTAIANLEPYSPEWVTKNDIPHSIWLRAHNDPKTDLLIPWDPTRVFGDKLPVREYPLTKEQHNELIAQGYEFLPLKDSY